MDLDMYVDMMHVCYHYPPPPVGQVEDNDSNIMFVIHICCILINLLQCDLFRCPTHYGRFVTARLRNI